MQAYTLLLLRISLAGLLLFWGANKLLNVENSAAISNKFYFSFMSTDILLYAFGTGQIIIGLLILAGWFRRFTYPLQIAINGASLIVVFPSIIDPLGWYLASTNILFYPSLIIFASSLLLLAFQREDRFSFDAVGSQKSNQWKARNICPREISPR